MSDPNHSPTHPPPGPPPPPPPPRRSALVTVLMILSGIALVLPGVCSLVFVAGFALSDGGIKYQVQRLKKLVDAPCFSSAFGLNISSPDAL